MTTTITITFNNKIAHYYDSFDELLQLPNYNEITSINCSNMNLTNLPQLPNCLTYLRCYYNELTSLPLLPNSLTVLYCWNNNLTSLPQLPNSLIKLDCENNNLISLLELQTDSMSQPAIISSSCGRRGLPNLLTHL